MIRCTCVLWLIAGVECALDVERLRRDVERLSVDGQRCLARAGPIPFLPDWRFMVGPAVEAVALSGFGVVGPRGHVYEFGVFTGQSMRRLMEVLSPSFLWGLDSFRGLPEYREERVAGWEPGKYRADPRAKLTAAYGADRVGFVEGFYDASLTAALARDRKMAPATYLDIDCDLYESSLTALDWAFRNGIAAPGTVVGYDDFWVFSCSNGAGRPTDNSEGRAHREITRRFGVEFLCVAGSCLNGRATRGFANSTDCDPYDVWGAVFLVLAVGGESPNDGFQMSPSEIVDFREHNAFCKRQHENAEAQGRPFSRHQRPGKSRFRNGTSSLES